MDVRQPAAVDARTYISHLKSGPAALTAPVQPGDIVLLKTHSFDFRMKVQAAHDQRFSGVIVECLYEHLIGTTHDFNLKYIWGRSN